MSLAVNSYKVFAFCQSFEAILIVINGMESKLFNDKIRLLFKMNAVLTTNECQLFLRTNYYQ